MDLEYWLDHYLDRHLSDPINAPPAHLSESIRYSLLGPGKRIRPRLLLNCAEMLGLEPHSGLPAAVAIEMVHCFTLIHDDLPCMDNDDFRRGRPSNHKRWGEATALLAGDALISLALDVFLESPVNGSRVTVGLKRLLGAMGPRGVIGGQAAECLLTPQSTLDDLRRIHRQKTGALFSAALLIPMDFVGIENESEAGRTLTSFADVLGLAFQIADDLEDTAETELKQLSGDRTNILSYLSATEAKKLALESLNRATGRLENLWNSHAKGLLEISAEVTQKINSITSADDR